jgi:hypothetical protein
MDRFPTAKVLWGVIVNVSPTGNSAEFAETVFRRNTQGLRTRNHATAALKDKL